MWADLPVSSPCSPPPPAPGLYRVSEARKHPPLPQPRAWPLGGAHEGPWEAGPSVICPFRVKGLWEEGPKEL